VLLLLLFHLRSHPFSLFSFFWRRLPCSFFAAHADWYRLRLPFTRGGTHTSVFFLFSGHFFFRWLVDSGRLISRMCRFSLKTMFLCGICFFVSPFEGRHLLCLESLSASLWFFLRGAYRLIDTAPLKWGIAPFSILYGRSVSLAGGDLVDRSRRTAHLMMEISPLSLYPFS